MSDKTSFSTYAITLYFDDNTTDWIRGLMAQFAQVTGNDFMTANEVPPHLTVGMFHVSEADVEKLKNLFEDFVTAARKCNSTFDISFSGYESFLDKVIFIKPEVDEKLSIINKLLHEKFLPHFEAGDNRNYLPENWYPHIALGVKLSHEQFERGMEFLNAQGTTCSPGLRASLPAQGIGGAPKALRSNGGESRNAAKPGLPSGRCAHITTIGLACCNPYTPIMNISL